MSTSDEGSDLLIYELPDGNRKSSQTWNKNGDVSFTSDGRRLVAASGRSKIVVLDLKSGKISTKPIRNTAKTLVVRASPSQPILVVGMGEKKHSEEKSSRLRQFVGQAPHGQGAQGNEGKGQSRARGSGQQA